MPKLPQLPNRSESRPAIISSASRPRSLSDLLPVPRITPKLPQSQQEPSAQTISDITRMPSLSQPDKQDPNRQAHRGPQLPAAPARQQVTSSQTAVTHQPVSRSPVASPSDQLPAPSSSPAASTHVQITSPNTGAPTSRAPGLLLQASHVQQASSGHTQSASQVHRTGEAPAVNQQLTIVQVHGPAGSTGSGRALGQSHTTAPRAATPPEGDGGGQFIVLSGVLYW